MNNAERNGYRRISLCDTHVHLVYPQTNDTTEKIFREIMEYFEITRINMQCIACGSGHRPTDYPNNIKGLYIRERLNSDGVDRAFVYGSLVHHFDGRDTADGYLSQITEMYEMGFDGYKMLEGKPEFRKKLGHTLCDPIFDKMFAFMEETGMPVKMHLGDPYTAWGPKETITPYALSRGWWYGDGTYPSFEALHDEVYGIMKKFPRLKLCMAHFFFLGHDLEQLRNFFESWENVSVDLTPGACMFKGFSENYDKARRFFEDFSDRIFFGSDTYNRSADGEGLEKYEQSGDAGHRINVVRTCLEKDTDAGFEEGNLGILSPLRLSEDILRNIYIDNHTRLHPSARKADYSLAAKHAEALLSGLEAGEISYAVEGENELETGNLKQIIEFFSK